MVSIIRTINTGLMTDRMEFIKCLNEEKAKFKPPGKRVG
jgi:hypothetical protein